MRVALGIEYDGGAYVGWQRQKNGTGIQSCVEDAIAKVASETVDVFCAGRTDAGVHASAQVVHFDTAANRTSRGWLLGVNSNLPNDINVTWAKNVDDDFHARFSAQSRTYRYLILNHLIRSSLFRERAWWVHESLDEAAMQEAASHLIGKHDFSAFRAAGCQASTPIREITTLKVARHQQWISIIVTADAFLHHMVRNIAGTLVVVGRGDEQAKWSKLVLASEDRIIGGVTAPSHGLTLIDVIYPVHLGVPPGNGDTPDNYVYDSVP